MKEKRSATTRQLHRCTLRWLDDVSHLCLFATQLREKKKKTSSGKGTENYRCNSVISGSANSSQLQLQLHLHTISSNGSIVFDFSKQLNDQPFAQSKAVDFALVVSAFKPPGINRFGILMPLKVGLVSQADLSRFFLEFCSSPNTWLGEDRLVPVLFRDLYELSKLVGWFNARSTRP